MNNLQKHLLKENISPKTIEKMKEEILSYIVKVRHGSSGNDRMVIDRIFKDLK